MQTLCKIRDIYRSVGQFEKQFEDRFGLSATEALLLYSLSDGNTRCSGDLAEVLQLSGPNNSKLLRTAENEGYIERTLGKNDKRQMYFHLTAKGREKLAGIDTSDIELPDILKGVM